MSVLSGTKKQKITTALVFVVSILIIIGGCALAFLFPRSSCVANSQENSAHDKKSLKEISTPQEYIEYLLSDAEICLEFDGTVEKLDYSTLKNWVSAKKEDGSFRCTADYDKLTEYAQSLAKKYDNYESHITFTTTYGDEVTLENRGTGWIFDSKYAADMLQRYIENGESVRLDLTDRSPESNKWWLRVCDDYDVIKNKGDSYAEVSIAHQYMWVYKNGKVILESPVVTGSPGENDTPRGAYIISEKKSPATLYGATYYTNVSYWMAFTYDIGFHDATWQESFGGDTYLYSGSHGCVNLPLSFAGKLYAAVYKNMPVYVY